MNKVESLILIMSLLIMSIISSAQVAVGQWQDHFSYKNGTDLILVGDDIYMTSECGILKYNTVTNEIEKLTKLNVLSDITPSGIVYDERTGSVIIGYSSGNVDVIKDNEITNINDIKKKSINSSKSINKILAKDGFAYLGCDFGVVVLNLKKMEISETWYIGNNATYVHVNDMEMNGDDIYVATNTGVLKGNLNDRLVDFSKWQVITDFEDVPELLWMKGSNYNALKWFNGNLIANYKSPLNNSDTLMLYDGSSWRHVMNELHCTKEMAGNNDTLICSTGYSLYTYNSNFEQTNEIWYYKTGYGWFSLFANSTVLKDGRFWIADAQRGLCWIKDDSGHFIEVNEPLNNKVFNIASAKSKVIAVSGGYKSSFTPTWTPPSLYQYRDYKWINQTADDLPELSGITDLVDVAIDPNDASHFFVSSWVKGLHEFRDNKYYKSYNTTNSTLMEIDGIDWIRVGSADFDKDGNLWVTNSLSAKCLHVMTPDGQWTGFSIPDMVKNIKQVVAASNGFKWIAIGQSGGLLVFDDNGTPELTSDDRYKRISVVNEDGEAVSNDVYSLAEDKNGYIWVGTAKGVVVYYNPDKVFDSSPVRGRQIKVPRNDGTNNADLLLSADVVTSICVDGANCKWFGTQNGGAYYTSADGVETIHNFNTENSPIPSDNILSIKVVPETGDVFFATQNGMVSYRGEATEGFENFDKIYAFPNPVRSDYDGPITIKGLVAGSIVKITDIAGNIVYEAKSTGGQVVWDGNNLNGNRVASGVYVVFSATEVSKQKSTTKIVFLN